MHAASSARPVQFMVEPLARLRLLLAALPAVAGIVLIAPGHYAVYTACTLLGLLMVKAGALFPKSAALMLTAELAGFTAIAYFFDGLLFLMLFSTLIAFYQLKPSAKLAAACSALGLASLLLVLGSHDLDMKAAFGLLWLATAVILNSRNELERKKDLTAHLYEKLEDSHEQLQAARSRMQTYGLQIEQYAQSEERNRIARDIHDDLGHRLIRVKMMAEAALHLHPADPDRAGAILAQVRDQLQEGMERMRHTVRKLSSFDEHRERKYALDRLVAESADALGIEISFSVGGYPRPMYPSMELVLFKNVQEAITNAVRHGMATAVEVTLAFYANDVSITVANNGALPVKPIAAGLGFLGMKERAAMLGGKVEWAQDEQFAVTTTLPLLGSNGTNGS